MENINASDHPVTKEKLKFPSITQTWYIILIFFVATIVVTGALALLVDGHNELKKVIGYTVPMLIIISVTLVYQKHDFGAKVTSLFRKFDVQIVPYLFFFVLGFGYTSDFLTSFFPMPEIIKKLFVDMVTFNVWSFMLACVAAPLFEELFCRGIILRSFLQNYSVKKAILWSAVFFAVMHLNPWQAIPALGFGLFLGWVYYLTQSLWPVIIVHFLNNSITYAMAGIMGPEYLFNKQVSFGLDLALAVGGTVFALFSVYRIWKIFKAKEKIRNEA